MYAYEQEIRMYDAYGKRNKHAWMYACVQVGLQLQHVIQHIQQPIMSK